MSRIKSLVDIVDDSGLVRLGDPARRLFVVSPITAAMLVYRYNAK